MDAIMTQPQSAIRLSVLTVCLLNLAVGCVAPGVRRSAIRWNFQAPIEHRVSDSSRALELASRKAEELKVLIDSGCSPNPKDLIGTWYGVNKGFGAAMAGLHQDIKVFQACEQGVTGHNILVQQVAVEELECKGWRSKRDPKTCEPKTMGNFVVETCFNERGKLILQLDYSQGENPSMDPSRYLVDELVLMEPDLLLGRARVRVGMVDMPIAYFVLFRAATPCD
jgi:hypothetical protein